MRYLTKMPALLLLAVGPSLAAPAPGSRIAPEARAVLEKAVASMGGDAALAAVTGMRTTYRGTYRSGSMPPMPYTSTLAWQAPDRIVWHLDAGVFRGSAGASGDRVWMAFMCPPARVRGAVKRSIHEWILMNDMLLVRPLLHRTDVKIAKTGEAKEGGARAETLLLKFDDGHRYALVFRSEADRTFLAMVKGEMTAWDGRRGTLKVTLSAPRAFGGILFPTKLHHESWIGGKRTETMEEEITAVEWNPKLGEGAFDMPEVKIPLGKPAVKEDPSFTALVVVHRGSYDGLGEAMKKAFRICLDAGLMVAGSVTAVYRNDPKSVKDPSELVTELALPVMLMGPAPTGLPGGAVVKTFPGARVAAMVVRGPYGTVEGPGLAKLGGWVKEKGLAWAGPPRVRYLHNPEGAVPEDQLAEIQIPVK